ncbi:MAG: dephospho-CoA kinase [Chthonomonadaceae bacterium]|nr:dephospho-CoA kinase [Chthonomonadaceae bacterium]
MIIGVTGGIATGKSTVMRLLSLKGVTVFSADEAAKAVLSPGGKTLFAIKQVFGSEVFTPQGSLDRQLLAKRIFAEPEMRLQLERITHPPLLSLLKAQITLEQYESSPSKMIAVEVPLLFETNLESWFDQIIVVETSLELQRERLRQRNHLSEGEIESRLAAQMPLSEKIKRADVVFNNEATPEDLQRRVDQFLQITMNLREI